VTLERKLSPATQYTLRSSRVAESIDQPVSTTRLVDDYNETDPGGNVTRVNSKQIIGPGEVRYETQTIQNGPNNHREVYQVETHSKRGNTNTTTFTTT
jgi:hypothetical protein